MQIYCSPISEVDLIIFTLTSPCVLPVEAFSGANTILSGLLLLIEASMTCQVLHWLLISSGKGLQFDLG